MCQNSRYEYTEYSNNKINIFFQIPSLEKEDVRIPIFLIPTQEINLDIWASYSKITFQTGTDKFGHRKPHLYWTRFFVFNRIEIPSDIPETALKAYTEKES